METKLIDLGDSIGKISGRQEYPHLEICTPTYLDLDQGHYCPAESISVYGKEPLKRLADSINECLKEK